MPAIKISLVLLLGLSIVFSGGGLTLAQGGTGRPAGWDDYSHGNATAPDYAVVFPQAQVNTLTITIAPATWQAMLADMTDLYGDPANRANPDARPTDPSRDTSGRNRDVNPMWAAVDIQFNDQHWTHVGMRFKGSSSLMIAWLSGILKMGFKLDFDQFEDDYPAIDNQRFFGFKQLSFSSNWGDNSFLREKVTADIFRAAGVPSAQTAFYAVYVDYGEGLVYFGLYTAVEVIEDTVIKTQFADDSGNVYKPQGQGATFAVDTFNTADFDKETNQDEADYSDILALHDALHAPNRLTDPATWRQNLEAVFAVDVFLRWLAVNEVVQNWDTYGTMTHNYYLYNNPATGQLTWIPWDNNAALASRGDGRSRLWPNDQPPTGTLAEELDLAFIGEEWVLIRYLLADPVYHALYVDYVEATINGAFEPQRMTATYRTLHAMIAPYVVGAQGEIAGFTFLPSPEAFDAALLGLIEHVNSRHAVAQDYVASQRALAE